MLKIDLEYNEFSFSVIFWLKMANFITKNVIYLNEHIIVIIFSHPWTMKEIINTVYLWALLDVL